jgi:hypothetical protein
MGSEQIVVLAERLALALERIALALEQQKATVVSSVSPAALSKEDAARFLGVDEATVEHLIRTRKLAYVQHGSQRGRVIPVESLRAFLKEYRQATGEELTGSAGRPDEASACRAGAPGGCSVGFPEKAGRDGLNMTRDSMAENSQIGWTRHRMNFWWGCNEVTRECRRAKPSASCSPRCRPGR